MATACRLGAGGHVGRDYKLAYCVFPPISKRRQPRGVDSAIILQLCSEILSGRSGAQMSDVGRTLPRWNRASLGTATPVAENPSPLLDLEHRDAAQERAVNGRLPQLS